MNWLRVLNRTDHLPFPKSLKLKLFFRKLICIYKVLDSRGNMMLLASLHHFPCHFKTPATEHRSYSALSL
jgi:hypothetical protein